MTNKELREQIHKLAVQVSKLIAVVDKMQGELDILAEIVIKNRRI